MWIKLNNKSTKLRFPSYVNIKCNCEIYSRIYYCKLSKFKCSKHWYTLSGQNFYQHVTIAWFCEPSLT